jgi:hypothetical protein
MKPTMTQADWQVAEAIAQALAKAEIDVNELRKVISYLRWRQNRGLLGDGLFEYLDRLAQHGEVRSGKTPQYYQTLNRVCRSALEPLQADIERMIQILGWAARLQGYYKQCE